MGMWLTCAEGIWGSGLHSAQGAAGWEVSQETPSRPGMTALHAAQTSIAFCGVGDLNVTGSCAALQGQHTGPCPCPHWGDSARAGAQTSALHRMLQGSENGDVENQQQHFVLQPPSYISSGE